MSDLPADAEERGSSHRSFVSLHYVSIPADIPRWRKLKLGLNEVAILIPIVISIIDIGCEYRKTFLLADALNRLLFIV